MKENMINFVCEHGRISKEELTQMKWSDQVDYILLHLAGGSNRWCIYKDFMVFMANYGGECIQLDRENGTELAPVLFTVAMQRLTRGAVLHDTVNFQEQLPEKFWIYSSANDDYHVMTPECLEFIYHGLPVAVDFQPTRDYALKITWGLLEHLDDQGKRYGGFSLHCENADEEGKKLYAAAVKIIETTAPLSPLDIFNRYAKPDQWQKHKAWLHWYIDWQKKEDKKVWENFFARIEIPQGLKSFRQRSRIKREILSEPMAK